MSFRNVPSRRPAERASASHHHPDEGRDPDSWDYPAYDPALYQIKESIDIPVAPFTPFTVSPSPSASSVCESPRLVYRQSNNDVDAVTSGQSLLSTSSVANAAVSPKSTSPPRTKNHGRFREPGYVPRPRNAFIVFRSYYIEKHRNSGEVQQNELSKAAGRAWKSMTDEEKREFKETADKEQAQHKIEHPNYQYAPGPRRPAPYSKSAKVKATRTAPRKTSAALASSSSRSARATRVVQDAPSLSPSSTSSEPYSPELIPCRSRRATRAAAQAAAERLEQLILEPSPPPASPLSPELELTYPSSDEVAPRSPTPEFDFVPTEHIPVLSLDSSPHHENEKEDIPDFTLDQPSTLDYFTFDPFLPYDAYPELAAIPSVVPLATVMSTISNNLYDWDASVEPAVADLNYLYPSTLENHSSNGGQLPLAELQYGRGGSDSDRFNTYDSDAQAQLAFDLGNWVYEESP